MEKVFCDNCKYSETEDLFEDGSRCLFPDSLYTGRMGKMKFKSSRNRKGDCKDYKRKWWKFWVNDTEHPTLPLPPS